MEASPQHPVHLSVSVVLHNNSLELLKRSLHSLLAAVRAAQKEACLGGVSIYLVDNASDAAYRLLLSELLASWPGDESCQLHYLPQLDNRGFGYGHNRVIESLGSDFHIVLNPDAELEVDTLCTGLSCMNQDDSIVLLSPRVFGPAGNQEFLCKRYPSALVLLLRGFAPGFIRRLFRRQLDEYEIRDLCSAEEQVEVDIASGCFMLVRSPALRAVGGFNEDFFLYFEDFDLSLRLQRQGRLVFNPAMRVVHHGGYAATKGLRHVRYFISSGLRFFNLHGWRWI
jgi:GT2 family glycosyltransferase